MAQAAHEAEEAIEDGDGVWRTAGDIQVNRNKGIGAVVYLAVAGKRAAGYGASADGDDQTGFGKRGVGFLQGKGHVFGDGAGDEESVGVARGCDNLDAEAAEVKDNGGEDVDVGFAGVAAAGADLSEFEGAAEKSAHFVVEGGGELAFLGAED